MSQDVINVLDASLAGDCRLVIRFDDGTTQRVDFKPFLMRARNPQTRAFADPFRFATFRVEYGELVWGDYELCFPMIDLHQNRIDRFVDERVAG